VTDVRSPRQSFCAALFTALLFFPLIAKADGKRLQRDDFRATTIDGVGIFVREIALPESKGAEPLILIHGARVGTSLLFAAMSPFRKVRYGWRTLKIA
jgi:hypothetical protein